MTKKHLILIFLLCIIIELFAKTPIRFTMGTYNIRNYNKEDSINGDGWKQRMPFMAKQILFHNVDILGTQEALESQLTDLKLLLPKYECIGIGREDGKTKGEHSAIFYRTDKFQVLDHGDFWLSEDQTKPNLGWDAACVRICSWGKFKEKKSGVIFMLFNLHMDHIGIRAREESAKLIIKKITTLNINTPTILCGDFNVDQFSPSYQLINNSGILKDTYDKAKIVYEPTNGTFNDFNPIQTAPGRIDHIFVTKDFTVLKYGILTDTYQVDNIKRKNTVFQNAHCISDHYPVTSTLEIQ